MASGDGESGGRKTPIDWRRLHLWDIQWVRDAMVILGVLGLVWLGHRLSVVTVPLLVAMLLAYLFEPLVVRMTRVRWISRQGAAAAIIIATVVVVIVPVGLGVGFAVVQGATFAGSVATNADRLLASVNRPQDEGLRNAMPESWLGLRDWLVELRAKERESRAIESTDPGRSQGDATPPVEAPAQQEEAAGADDEVPEDGEPAATGTGLIQLPAGEDGPVFDFIEMATLWVKNNAQALAERALRTGAGAVGIALGTVKTIGFVVFGLFLTAFFFFFVSTGWGKVLDFWEGLIPERKKGRVLDLVGQMDRVIAGFVRGRLTIAAIQAVVFTAGYWMIGVPAALILGPLVAVLSIVPYMALVGIPISMLLMFLDSGGASWQREWWWILAAPVGLYFLIQALDDYVWTPMIQGKTTDMSTPMILFASIAGGALMGVYGLLLAIPLAACLKILIREIFWPRFRDWAKGRERDFLPIGRG